MPVTRNLYSVEHVLLRLLAPGSTAIFPAKLTFIQQIK